MHRIALVSKTQIMYKVLIISFLVLFTACSIPSHEDAGQQESSHQHAEEGSQHTLYSDHYEFFIEHPPLVAGEEAVFLVHLTDLSTYKPCLTGNVTIHIDGVSVTSGGPSTPGIFMIPLVPKKAGAFHAVFSYADESIFQSVEEHPQIFMDHAAIHADEPVEDAHADGLAAGSVRKRQHSSGRLVERVLDEF